VCGMVWYGMVWIGGWGWCSGWHGGCVYVYVFVCVCVCVYVLRVDVYMCVCVSVYKVMFGVANSWLLWLLCLLKMGDNVCEPGEYYVTQGNATLPSLPVRGNEAAVAHQGGRKSKRPVIEQGSIESGRGRPGHDWSESDVMREGRDHRHSAERPCRETGNRLGTKRESRVVNLQEHP
jgi:hypothetical protein